MIHAASNLRIQAFRPDSGALIKMLADPVLAVSILLAAAWAFTGSVDSPYIILALLVFAMTFPAKMTASGLRTMAAAIFAQWGLLFGVLLSFGWTTQVLYAFDPGVIVAWVVATPLALLLVHATLPRLLSYFFTTNGLQRTAVIAGANEIGTLLAQSLEANSRIGTRFAGYFDDRKDERAQNIANGSILGSLSELPEFVRSQQVDVIYCALPMSAAPRIRQLMEELHDTTASIYFVPNVLCFNSIQPRLDTVGGVPVIAMCESPYYGVRTAIKRISDILISTAILIVLLPLMVLLAIGVKMSSSGPILFTQCRYGADGKKIVVYKFRTMVCQDNGDVVEQAQRNDPRVTPLGAFLRKYSLDELPQFVNVLQGRMSVVGPRPHAVAHNEMYRKLIHGYMLRHKVKPGITGLAQINGLRGETDTVDKMRARVELDLEYLRNWSLLLDLKIVLKTVGVALRNENAY